MSGPQYGFKRAIGEVITGVVTSAIVDAFATSGLLPSTYLLLFGLLNVIGIAALVFAMPFWGVTYLLGWIFRIWVMASSGLIGILEIILYVGVPIAVLIVRLVLWVNQSFEGYSYAI